MTMTALKRATQRSATLDNRTSRIPHRVVTKLLVLQLLSISVLALNMQPSMDATYDKLASRLHRHLHEPNHQHWVAIAGGPGSGKTSTAEAIAERLNASKPNSCVVLPMDGFHYSTAKLKELDPPNGVGYLRRRGAPWTFDAELCVGLLSKAKRDKMGSFPMYDRTISDPVPNGVTLAPEHKVVLIEGLYLLWKDDERWAPLQSLWDERWFIKAPSLEIQRQRLIKRSLKTWSDAKAKLWGEGDQGAAARVDANDVKTMNIIAHCEDYADTVIETI
jgi:pantothenate kinase